MEGVELSIFQLNSGGSITRLISSVEIRRLRRLLLEHSTSIKKVIFSRSLDSAEDKNTRIVRTNLHDEILKLKREQGKNILVGSVNIPSQLIELGLVDEYRFVVSPIVAGEGRRLLEGVSLRERVQLKLVDSKIFKSGCVAFRYLKTVTGIDRFG